MPLWCQFKSPQLVCQPNCADEGLTLKISSSQTLSTQLIILNYPGILSHQGSTTVSLENYPFYLFIIIKSQLELKKNNNNNNNNKNHHDSQRLTKCDPPHDFRDKGDNTHTTHQHIVQNAHCSRDIYQQQRKIYRSVILAAKCTLESLDWSLITLAFLLRDYNALAHQIILFMLLHVRKKITHSCLCYILDKHSILKPSVTYSFLSTPYSINT